MNTIRNDPGLAHVLASLFGELVDGAPTGNGAFVLNSGDIGLLRSLDKLSAIDASRSTNGGATIAAHAEHLRFGLGLMNQWAKEGGDPFANAAWDAAWKISAVDEGEWAGIRRRLTSEAQAWRTALGTPRDTSPVEMSGLLGSIVHLAYHLGAIRQIARDARGPREGTFDKKKDDDKG